MKYIALALLLLSTAAAAQQKPDNTAAVYNSGSGEMIVLMKERCPLSGYPGSAQKAVYVAYMTMAEGCYMVTGQDRVLISMPNGSSRTMYREQFRQWDIK